MRRSSGGPTQIGRARHRLAAAIAAAAGVDGSTDAGIVSDLAPAPGGDVSRAVTAVVAGRRVFVKYLDPPVPGLLTAEAASLRWLAAAEAVAVPEVVGVADQGVLVLEHVAGGPPAVDHDERLGRGLARLHLAGADTFGAPWPGFVGPLAHPNDATSSWAEFLAEQRWRPAAMAGDRRGALPPGTTAALDRLVDRLPGLLGDPEPPARLHGDLWAGNAMVGPDGQVVLVDPASFGGHREVDLAMMRLFGGFTERTFAAYDEAHPLADGHAERVALHQLHPLLVHAALFAGGYGQRARAIIDHHL